MRLAPRLLVLTFALFLASGTSAQQTSPPASAYMGTWHHTGSACASNGASSGTPNEVTISFTDYKDGVFGGQIWTPCENQHASFTTSGTDPIVARLRPDGSVIVSMGDRSEYVLRFSGPARLQGDFRSKSGGTHLSVDLNKEG
jgi:hypothetical protein